jgi:hypothetical protein
MLASTVQFSTNTKPTTNRTDQPTPHQTSHPTSRPTSHQGYPCRQGSAEPTATPHGAGCFRTQQDVCTPPTNRTTTRLPHPHRSPRQGSTSIGGRCRPGTFTSVSAIEHPTTTSGWHGLLTPITGQVLLRKEVIQPHLPVRLPCYDFVPIASPTFDGSLPAGLGHRLRVLPTFVT